MITTVFTIDTKPLCLSPFVDDSSPEILKESVGSLLDMNIGMIDEEIEFEIKQHEEDFHLFDVTLKSQEFLKEELIDDFIIPGFVRV